VNFHIIHKKNAVLLNVLFLKESKNDMN